MPLSKSVFFSASLILPSFLAHAANADQLPVQVQFPPLTMQEAPRGGAHPVGGPAHIFIDNANALLGALDLELVYHVTDKVPDSDRETVQPKLVSIPEDFANLYEAVAAGPDAGGLAAAIGLPISNGLESGQLLVAGMPFGLHPSEFASWLISGGGLELEQDIYNEAFDNNLVVVPIALTSGQEAGFFPEPLPTSMTEMCQQPWLARWPAPASAIWQQACQTAGVETTNIGAETLCADPSAACPSEGNPVKHDINTLTFGGFQPGRLPQQLRQLDQVDAYELNLPYTGVLMMKRALGLENESNDTVDLSPIIEKAPYFYLNAWHQPLSYIELLVNRQVWDNLSEAQRVAIRTSGQASMLETLAVGLEAQGEAIEILKRNGAEVNEWPVELLKPLQEATMPYLEGRAEANSAEGDDSYRRILDHMHSYQEERQIYFNAADAPRTF
ncbi:hypothetical protein [Chromohalobacter nigrandesensis]|uniref:hypothetical protein n=1 Tax=Chromohalobacter nigrandesensis TaxID=119863 RepID=UPI001FF4FD0A|nr:hypothetical protein [Chromohalobacter nigrandesensis]MCK0746019.1 hypothetical protein [Chromohalobacter nigrandesensis]